MNNKPMLVMFTGGDLLNISNYRCATPAEIMAAHPKCGECRHKDHSTFWGFDECVANPLYPIRIDPTTDYCNKWEGKQ